MLERQEQLAVFILVAVMIICGTATVILETMGKEPFARHYDPSLSDGTLVSWGGVVQKITLVSQGSSLIMDVGGVPIYLSSPSGLVVPKEGDRVTLFGVMQTWNGKREILVSDSKDIRITVESQGKNLRS